MSIFGEVAGDLDAELLRRCMAGDERACRELAEGFWDRQYIRKFGLPGLPALWELGVRFPPRPEPDPSPVSHLVLLNEIMAHVLGFIARDPEPQANLRGRNLVALLSNKSVRLQSATKLHARMLNAVKALEAEVKDLSH